LTRFFDLVKSVIILAIVIYLIHIFVITLFVVDGASMEPNFQDKNYLFVDKASYWRSQPGRGDVIVFNYPGSRDQKFIKRIIGLPGEEVEIKDNAVYIKNSENTAGFRLTEAYLPESFQTSTYSGVNDWKLGDGEYFVLGDNRGNSSDSRIWGLLPRSDIIGKASVFIWPLDKVSYIPKPLY
jgi:signal peptidase I